MTDTDYGLAKFNATRRRDKVSNFSIGNPENSERVMELFWSLANPIRARILCAIAHEEVCVGELAERFKVRDATISQHLGLLRKNGTVKARKENQQVYYSLSDSRICELAKSVVEWFS